MRLQGKVAIVTGASSGIGKATAKMFAREGAKVVVSCHNAQRGPQVAEEMKSEGFEATFVLTDVASAPDLERMIKTAVEKYGRLDILVNNAGVLGESDDDTTEEKWHRVMDVNLTGPFLACKMAIPIMKNQGGGSIVNVSSNGGLRARGRSTAYASSKAGLIMLSRSLARIHGKDNVRVNCVCPGPTETNLWFKHLDRPPTDEEVQKARTTMGERSPRGRAATAEEVAYANLFLASCESSGISGVALPVDGAEIA